MARHPANNGAGWTAREVKTLRSLAKAGHSTTEAAKALGRTVPATQQKAMRSGISFRALKPRAPARKK